jgi:cytidine deaminase
MTDRSSGDGEKLIAEARKAAVRAYAPYSGFHVGAALLFDDDTITIGSNFENASYGLSICAETAAVLAANQAGKRSGLLAVGIFGGTVNERGIVTASHDPVTPCGRCRQVLTELAQLGGSDPVIYCGQGTGFAQFQLSDLLPHAFGPASLK